jgi:hypothetical protein
MIKRFENMDNNPELKMETKEVHLIDYNDFDDYINKIYPFLKNFEFVADHEANNYSCYKFEANKLKFDFDIKDYEIFKTGVKPRWFNVHHLFDYMVEDGYIQPGTYIITVYW